MNDIVVLICGSNRFDISATNLSDFADVLVEYLETKEILPEEKITIIGGVLEKIRSLWAGRDDTLSLTDDEIAMAKAAFETHLKDIKTITGKGCAETCDEVYAMLVQ
jgi:hypothetical protein